MRLVPDSFPRQPSRDIALSRALLMQLARGEIEPVLRLYRPGPTVAFGRLDALRPGFAQAIGAARAHGFEPVVRISGGHAAAYDGGALVYEEIVATQQLVDGIRPRFEAVSGLLAEAFVELDLDARVGELPGAYCPGDYSVNVAGRIKIVGTAQRVVRGAALVSAVVLVRGGSRLRAVLVDVYAALGLDWEPSTAGAIDDIDPAIELDVVERAIRSARQARGPLEAGGLEASTLELAANLEEQHRAMPPTHAA